MGYIHGRDFEVLPGLGRTELREYGWNPRNPYSEAAALQRWVRANPDRFREIRKGLGHPKEAA